MAADILSHLFDRYISAFRFLVQRLQNDFVEIAPHVAPDFVATKA
jgi:hypothetical protein